ncbi:hypothetical protein B0A51_16457 [Lecanosticta acicola]|uniref:Mid2 domain-containing protein n=1 Tax=Lecanosticta acicola TaxID=111012 RepID=A0AAI9E8K3_9PEZI|nr:hypothetical protein B0A51_16457 [Lecanosticta acicola]
MELSFYGLVISTFLISWGAAQTTTHLPAPPTYTDGKFTNPDTSKAQIFTDGSEMNVTWTTTYDSVTLWLIYDGHYNNPTLLISGTTQDWYLWTVNDDNNNTRPFSFRAVSTDGTQQQQRQGGFYTGQFWIQDSSNPGRGSSATTTTTATTSAASVIGASTTPLSASALGNAASQTASSTASPSSSSSATSSSSNGTAIGVGVGVGVGVALLIIAGFAFWFIRRNKAKKAAAAAAAPRSDAHWSNTYAPSEMTQAASPQPYHSGMKSPQPSEMAGNYWPAPAVEAPNLQEPRELEADTSGAALAGPPAPGENKPPTEYR